MKLDAKEWMSLESRCLRMLVRYEGVMTEGVLASRVNCELMEPEFQEVLSALEKSGLVAVSPSGHGRARRVSLTKAGNETAQRILRDRYPIAQAEIAATVRAK